MEVEAAPGERLRALGEGLRALALIISEVEALAGEVSVEPPGEPLARGAAGGAAGGRFAGNAGQGQRNFRGGARDTDVFSGNCCRAGSAQRANVNTGNINTGNVNVNRSATVNGYGGYGRYGYGWGAAAAGAAAGVAVGAAMAAPPARRSAGRGE